MSDRVTVEGWLQWQLIEDGKVVQEGEQHNLLLNSGLDQMAQYGLWGTFDWCCVGTGSAAPDVAQVALGAQLARTNYAPSAMAFSRVSDGVGRFTITREFTEAQAVGNLTEWGMAPTSAGNIAVRELFRDGSNNPVVVTKSNAQRLRMVYTLEVRATPMTWTAANVTINSVGTRAGQYRLNTVNGYDEMKLISAMMTGTYGGNPNYQNWMGFYTAASLRTSGAGLVYQATNGPLVVGSPAAYTAGTYTRAGATYTWGTSNGSGLIVGFGLSAANDNGSGYLGYLFTLNAGQEFTKADTDQLTITGPAISWGRV